jgi:MoaA/NifB/PqqE/SkfB family radical SAM enzyme
MEEKIKRLVSWARGKPSPPFVLDLNPTDRCNLRCLSCWQRAEVYSNLDSSYELSDDKLLSLAEEAIELGIEEFEITGGGEPWIRRLLLLQVFKLIKKANRFGNITTNGTLFTPQDLRFLTEIGWDRITFSIDGPDAKTNDFLRGRGTYRKIMKNIETLNYWKKELDSSRPVIKFNVVISKRNYDKVYQFIELAQKVGCEIVAFESLTVHSRLGQKLKLNPKEQKELEVYALKALELAKNCGVFTNLDGFLTDNFIEKSNEMQDILSSEGKGRGGFLAIPCYEPWWHLVVKVDGSLQPCCLYDIKEVNAKDVSLKEAWLSKTFERIRNDMLRRKFSSFCSICNAGQVMENRRIRAELAKVL